MDKVPLAIQFVHKKDREMIDERITFLASDGVEILKQYLEWRKKYGDKKVEAVSAHMFNKTIKYAAKKAGLGNGNGTYGRLRTHSLRKFFITQLINHGVEDKILNFFICHKIPEVDRVYWFRKVDELRKIYAQRQQYLNPINGKKNVYDSKTNRRITG